MKKFIYLIIILSGTLISCAQTGRNASSDQKTPENDGVTIGLFADPQYADVDDRGPRHYRSSLQKIPECIDTFNTVKVDLVVGLGDIVDRDQESFDTILPLIDKSEAPVYYILGNHDYRRLRDLPGLLQKLGMPSRYYQLRMSGWRFLFLDTNDISSYSIMGPEKHEEYDAMLSRIRSEGTPNGESWNGGVGKEQMQWLADQLDRAAEEKEKVIVFGHHPLRPMNNHTLFNAAEVAALLNSSPCVKAYVNGHFHPGCFEEYDGLPCLTLEAMLEGGRQNSFATMTLKEDRMELKGYGRVQSRTILFR